MMIYMPEKLSDTVGIPTANVKRIISIFSL